MAQILTIEEKAQKRLRDNLRQLTNRTLSAWSFKQIKTWEDVNKYIPNNKTGVVVLADLKDFINKQVEELERKIKNPNEKIPIINQIQQTSSKTEQEKSDVETSKKEPDSWYGLHKSPKESASLFWFQKKAIKEAWDKITKEKRHGVLLLSGTGTGKTWMVGGLVRRLDDINFQDNKTWSHIPYLYVTRATVVSQTERVLKRDFNLNKMQLEVINIEQLRSIAGQYWVEEKLKIEDGEEKSYWEWKKGINPVVVLWDECQALKNAGSTQHQIASAFSNLASKETYQIFVATPFTKVIEAKCFAVSTKKPLDFICGRPSGLPAGSILSNETWPTYASIIATDGGRCDSKPDEYNEAAVERLMNDLEDYVVRVKGVRPQFEAQNTVEMIEFDSDENRAYYRAAWERYLAEKAKLEAAQLAGDAPNAGMMIIVQFLKYRMAAEYCRRNYFAKSMYESVQRGKAAVCAVNFKNTIVSVVKILVEQYHVDRNDISLIWGGGQTQLTKKQLAKKQIKEMGKGKLEAMGISAEDLLKDLDLDTVEDRELIEVSETLRLGMQSLDERQSEIDKFQSGKTHYCMYTLRAGGVGLSLHHTDEMTKEKVRKKESGYAIEEDIARIPVRQREVLVAPTWSPIEFVQGVGRVPRLTSLSPTKQKLVFYRGTIEGRVADIASKGLRCLSKIVKSRESWSDMILHSDQADYKKYMDNLQQTNGNDETGIVGEGGEE